MALTDVTNYKRTMLRLLHEIAKEQDIDITIFSQGWIIRLQKAKMVHFIYGYNFDLNSATAQLIADDKSAVSDLLAFYTIPHVEHKMFLQPSQAHYVSSQGSWANLISYAVEQAYQLVVKPNSGSSGGQDVYRVANQLQLEQAVHDLFAVHRAVCLSPFYDIQHEYRVIVLNGRCELIYAKVRPTVVGDGKQSAAELIAAAVKTGTLSAQIATQAVMTMARDLARVLDPGEHLILDWRHNLSQGARPIVVTDEAILSQLRPIALQVASALQINFASIDIISVDNQLLVLEVNAGIMMESFARLAQDGYKIAKRVHATALEQMFR